MKIVADLHLHSKYARAVSPQMILQNMAFVARQKGIDLLSASDFTHPLWLNEIKEQLQEVSGGIYRLKSERENEKKVSFMPSTEIACIYKQGEKLRRIHLLVYAPSFTVVEKINATLIERGANLHADGRPIIGMSARDLLELVLLIDSTCFIIPAHAWTPHFGVYGSASGFNSLDECFKDMSSHIYGIETGLSSDPEMNWQIEELQNRSILSFSDAHSLPKMGRELTVFESKQNRDTYTYIDIFEAIKKDSKGSFHVGSTIEFYPEEGKYHYSGHRNCHVRFGPEEIRERGVVCPVCGRNVTEGVLFRLQELATKFSLPLAKENIDVAAVKWYTDPNLLHPPYVKLVQLLEIIAETFGVSVGSKKVQLMYIQMIQLLGSELDILLRLPEKQIAQASTQKIAQGVIKVRKGELSIAPGFDGEYGKVTIWDTQTKTTPQLSFDL